MVPRVGYGSEKYKIRAMLIWVIHGRLSSKPISSGKQLGCDDSRSRRSRFFIEQLLKLGHTIHQEAEGKLSADLKTISERETPESDLT